MLDVTQLLTSIGVDPAQAPTGGITVVQSGGTPSLIAAGRITDPTSGFSSTIHFPSPDVELSSALHATGVPIGVPSSDSPFVGAGTFTPHVVVRNLLASAQTVTVTLEYPQPPTGTGPVPAPLDPFAAQDGTHSPATVQSLVTTTTVPAYTTQDISLAAMLSVFPAALPFAAVRIQYSGAPGSLQAEVPSVESAGNMVVDSIVQNEGNGWAGSGANPWHLDPDTESILFLTNASDQPAHIGFSVTASASPTYYLTKLLLNPHETRAIDIRKLRDAQKPDFRKNLIPAGSTDGSINWVRGDNLPVVGRVMQINRKAGLASNYDCGQCSCPYNYTPAINYLAPPSQDIPVGSSGSFVFYAGYADCNNNDYYYDYTFSASWSSGNSRIASSQGYGNFLGVSGGSTSVSASYTDSDYTFNGSHCSPYPVPGGASGQIYVHAVQVTSLSLPLDQVGVTLTDPSGASGQLVVTWNGPSGNSNIASGSYALGTYTFNPSLSSLVAGQYTGVNASWTVSGSQATGNFAGSFMVLGTYTHTTYNTPAESQCSANPSTAYLTTGPSSCPWSTVSLKNDFITQVWSTGSGATISYGLIQEYLAGCSAPPGGSQNYFREVSSVLPGCSSPNNYLSNTTLAVDVSSSGHPLSCGDSVLIVGLGGGPGTVKSVTDSCPACNGLTKVDDYNTTSACNPPSVGSFPTIRINR